jgi:hypothetical protein
MALLDLVGGVRCSELGADDKCSNGINAVLFALYNGATAVIITGINPASGGHIYNHANLARLHIQRDREILLRLMERGYPVFTADPTVSESLGLPLWDGKAPARQESESPEKSARPASKRATLLTPSLR